MEKLAQLFLNNRAWSSTKRAEDPQFFDKLAARQAPEYLWIGCADSRKPATAIIGLEAGDLFVHRNIANQCIHSDFNYLAVLQYAVDVLAVKHVIVCGHYGCGGVQAAMQDQPLGLIDNWLRHIREIRHWHAAELETIADPEQRLDRLCELNVVEQVRRVAQTSIVQAAWARGQTLDVHGWIFDLRDGLLRDLGVGLDKPADLAPAFRLASDTPAPAGGV